MLAAEAKSREFAWQQRDLFTHVSVSLDLDQNFG